ncbi:MAG: hypothetical protein II205_02925 [Bacteroidales bacterium]|nr:hypothetical protein [Bacteroidales bacterium]
MKKIIAVIASLTLGFCVANAQDLQSITEMYNTAASSISVNKTSALSTFEQVYGLATALGEEGAEIADQCKGIIPSLYLAIAKDLVGESNYDGAIAQLNKAIEIAAKYENAEVATEAKELVPQVLMQSAGTLLNAKKYAEAAAIYKQVVDADAANGVAALRLGLALTELVTLRVQRLHLLRLLPMVRLRQQTSSSATFTLRLLLPLSRQRSMLMQFQRHCLAQR